MKQGEKIATVLSGILFLTALAWALFSGGPDIEGQGVSNQVPEATFAVRNLENGSSKDAVNWRQPTTQGGANWIFDIFTPPVIYYDAETGTFTVTPPFSDAGPVEEAFELKLVEINPVPFRFQLVSYAGANGNYVLTLENLETGKDVFCSPRETLTDHHLKVLDFVEKREVVTSAKVGSTEAFDFVGEALVEDQSTGQQYTLRHNQLTFMENPVARFIALSGEKVALSVGESWDSDNATYTVTSVDLADDSATVEKTSSDVGDKVEKILQSLNSFNTSDLSNRKPRTSDPQPGTF